MMAFLTSAGEEAWALELELEPKRAIVWVVGGVDGGWAGVSEVSS